MLGGATVSWKSSKQICIARSTMELEFIALDEVGEEEKLYHFLEDMSMWTKHLLTVITNQQLVGHKVFGGKD